MCLPLAERKAVEQPAQFPRRNGSRALAARRPLKCSALETTVEEPESIMHPVQNLELIAFTIAEDEQARGEWVETEAFLYDGRKSVDGLTQIR